MLRPYVLLSLSLGSLVAQERVDPRCFMVNDYKNVVAADLAKLRQLGIWDEFETSALKLAFSRAEEELGFPLESLDRFTMTMSFPDDERQQRGERRMRMFVLEGGEELTLPESMQHGYEAKAYGRFELYQREWDEQHAFVRPDPKTQVWGDADVIKAALDGTRKPGLPSADVMSLSVGRGHRVGYMVADLSEQSARRTFLDELFEGSEWPADDMPTFFAGRVLATGDEDDRHLTLEVVLRHAKVGDGVAASDVAVDALLARAKEMPELRLFRKILDKAEKKVSGSDVVVSVDLGRSRDAVGNLAMAIAPLFLLSSRDAAAQLEVVEAVGEVEVVEEVEEPPPPPPPEPRAEPVPESGGGGEGGGR